MNILNNKYTKIVLVLGGAFLISQFGISNVFLANSPRVNPFFAKNMWNKTSNFVASINIFSGKYGLLRKGSSIDVAKMLETPLKKVSQGVYAGERDGYQVYEVRSDDFTYKVYKFNVNGKEVEVKVAETVSPPTQAEVENLYH